MSLKSPWRAASAVLLTTAGMFAPNVANAAAPTDWSKGFAQSLDLWLESYNAPKHYELLYKNANEQNADYRTGLVDAAVCLENATADALAKNNIYYTSGLAMDTLQDMYNNKQHSFDQIQIAVMIAMEVASQCANDKLGTAPTDQQPIVTAVQPSVVSVTGSHKDGFNIGIENLFRFHSGIGAYDQTPSNASADLLKDIKNGETCMKDEIQRLYPDGPINELIRIGKNNQLDQTLLTKHNNIVASAKAACIAKMG